MSELFPGQNPDDNGPQTAGSPPANQMIGTSIIKPTPHLPVTAAPYKNPRDPLKRVADPIGLAGLPDTRYGLECKLLELCNRLASAGGQILSAKRLVTEMELTDDRTLRLLAAYGHVQHRIRQLVGIEGVGYCWGDSNEGGYEKAAAIARRKGLCSLFLAGLYSKQPAAVQMAQMALGFRKKGAEKDELDAWLAGEDVTPATLIEAFITTFAETAEGRDALAEVGARHVELLMPKAIQQEIVKELDQIKARILGLSHKKVV